MLIGIHFKWKSLRRSVFAGSLSAAASSGGQHRTLGSFNGTGYLRDTLLMLFLSCSITACYHRTYPRRDSYQERSCRKGNGCYRSYSFDNYSCCRSIVTVICRITRHNQRIQRHILIMMNSRQREFIFFC